MDVHKHALLATLSTPTRTAIWSIAKDNGLGVDDVIQALLGRTESPGEGARLLAQKLIGDTDEDVLLELATLADTWPMPGPTEAELTRAREEEAKARAVTRDEKIHEIMDKVRADAIAAHATAVTRDEKIEKYPLDANGLPRLAIIVSGGTLKEGAEKSIVDALRSHDEARLAAAISEGASPGARVTIENMAFPESGSTS
jgi:hypothetical protein